MKAAYQPSGYQSLYLLLGLVPLCLLSLWFALIQGSLELSAWQVLQGLFAQGDSLAQQVVLELRLPRALTALICGGLLGLAGVLIQLLLHNPLGDPYVLGISGGASGGVLLAMLANSALLPLPLGAALGALLAMLLVFGLASRKGFHVQPLLLTGVIMAAGWGALINLVLSLSPTERLPGMLFWLMGDLSANPTENLLLPGLVLGLGMLLALVLAPQLNLLLQGELQAASLGIEVTRLRILLFVLSSILTAAAVMLAGNIGFIGLLAPHLFRLAGGSDHRLLIPGAMLTGAILLLLADTLARTLAAPLQLPVGALTALLGVPLFLYLLGRR
jgi:iron complex transport system permease protein